MFFTDPWLHRRGVLTTSPYDDRPVGISGQNVPILRERQARHVFRTVPCGFEHSVTLVQSTTSIQSPETDVTLTAGHYLITFQRMKFRGYHRVHRALKKYFFIMTRFAQDQNTTTNLGLRDLVTFIVPLPVPDGYIVVVSLVDSAQKTTAILQRNTKNKSIVHP